MTLKKIEIQIRDAVLALELAKTNCFDEPMIDKKYNIEKAEQDIYKNIFKKKQKRLDSIRLIMTHG